MAKTLSDDILLPSGAEMRPRRTPLAAFVPIIVALVGVAAILLGGVSARDILVAGQPAAIDPVVTGSVQPQPASEPGHVQRWE